MVSGARKRTERLDRGVEVAFGADFAELASLAYRVAYRLLGRRSDAEDIAQETLARAYVRWGSVQGHAEAWVVRVATNLALGVHRREGRDRRARPHLPEMTALSGAADRLDLLRLLESLPRRQREVLALRYLGDLPERETAAALGCSVGTVKQHAHRGVAALRASMVEVVPEPEGC